MASDDSKVPLYPRILHYCANPIVKRPASVSQLDLFIGQDGLLRCNGRFSNSKERHKTPNSTAKEIHSLHPRHNRSSRFDDAWRSEAHGCINTPTLGSLKLYKVSKSVLKVVLTATV